MDMDIDIDPRILNLTYRELQGKCKEYGLPATGKRAVIQKNLNDYMINPKDTLKRLAKEAIVKKGCVDWKNSAAREILLEDLEPPHGWLYGKDDLDAEHVYSYYKSRYEDFFEDIPFKMFQTRYNEAIEKAERRRVRSKEEEQMLLHDRRLHPRQTHNSRGEPVWDLDEEVKALLKFDIDQKQLEERSPEDLWLSRKEYRKYKLRVFRQRIYQHIKTGKFYNLLEKKRTEKRDEHKAKLTPQEVTFERPPATKFTKQLKIDGQWQRKRKRASSDSANMAPSKR